MDTVIRESSLQVRGNPATSYSGLTPEVMAALRVLLPLNRDRRAIMEERIARAAPLRLE